MSTNPEIDALIAAFYAAFDNREASPDGVKLRAMFVERAAITRIDGEAVSTWDVGGFIAPRLTMLGDGTLAGFHEWEVEARTEVQGRIASRWSRYAKSGVMNGLAYHGGGTKFIQLCRTGAGWRISAILWEDDAAAN